uniref:Uncharacterized protein n=1 Tax=Peronospora matthiolae TaxID=2874970 RepID=A0AAV1UQ14_9STRA
MKELPRPLAWLSTYPGQLGASRPLIVGVLDLVEQYDETHSLRPKKGRRKKTSSNASTGIAKCQSFRTSQKRCAPSSRDL